MNKISLILSVFALLISLNSKAQTSIVSTCGYTVYISYNPVAIVPFTTTCPWGYNFNVQFNYVITVQGVNTCSNGNVEISPGITCSSITNVHWTLYIPAPIVGAPFSTTTYSGTATTTTGLYNTSTNCATATPANTGCTGCSSNVVGPGIALGTYPCSFVVALPVDLVLFTGDCNAESVVLDWTTASERNNDYFTIERTQDFVTFEEVGEIDGMGNSNQRINYSFMDTEPLSGNSYYRLRQTDFDGKQNYSNTVVIDCIEKKSNISIYPNPNNGNFTIEGTDRNVDLTVFNPLGEKITEQKITSRKTEIQLDNLTNGIYFIQLSSEEETITQMISINK